MLRRLFSLVIAAACCLSIAESAHAEPVTAVVAAGVREYYDSNIFRLSSAERQTPVFDSIDDYVLEPHIGGILRVPVSLQTIELQSGFGYSFHRYNERLDAETLNLLGRWRWQVSDVCEGALEYGRTRRLVEFDDLEERRRIIQIGRSTNAEGGCAITPRLRGSVDYESSERDNRDPLSRIPDLDQESIETRLSYGRPDSLTVYAFGRYRRRTQPLLDSDDFVHATIRDFGGGFAWPATSLLRLEGAFYASRLRETTGLRNDNDFSGTVSADWAILRKARLRLMAERVIDVSPNISAIAFHSRAVRGTLDWEATPRLTMRLEVAQRWRSIQRTRFDAGGTPFDRFERDRTLSLDAALLYAFNDVIQGRLGVGHRDRSANFEDLRFRATVASLGLTIRLANPMPDAGILNARGIFDDAP